jgi:hypothetical protein
MEAKTTPQLRDWLDSVKLRNERSDALALICRDRGLDPETTTIKQIMELN